MTPWHEDDALWAELLPDLTAEGLWNAAAEEARQAAELLGIAPGAHVLDLGCGPGRHSIALARLGYHVTGVDRTAVYLEHACRVAEGLGIEFVRDSMLSFRREAAFDGAISLLSSFGYFESREDDLRVLRNVRASLKPGARAVIEAAGKEILARIFSPLHWQETRPGRYWLQDREAAPGWERLRQHWIFVGAGETREYRFEHRVYSGVELADLMRQTGFARAEVFGGLDGSPYGRDASRLVVVGYCTPNCSR